MQLTGTWWWWRNCSPAGSIDQGQRHCNENQEYQQQGSTHRASPGSKRSCFTHMLKQDGEALMISVSVETTGMGCRSNVFLAYNVSHRQLYSDATIDCLQLVFWSYLLSLICITQILLQSHTTNLELLGKKMSENKWCSQLSQEHTLHETSAALALCYEDRLFGLICEFSITNCNRRTLPFNTHPCCHKLIELNEAEDLPGPVDTHETQIIEMDSDEWSGNLITSSASMHVLSLVRRLWCKQVH